MSVVVVTLVDGVNSPCATSKDVLPSFGLGVNQPPGKNLEDDDDDEESWRLWPPSLEERVVESHFGSTHRYATMARSPNNMNFSSLAKSSDTLYPGRNCTA